MICWQCGKENKDTAKNCKQCSVDLRLPPIWRPTWQWHIKAISIIYAVVIIVYFVSILVIKRLPHPYNQREIPEEMTPWIK